MKLQTCQGYFLIDVDVAALNNAGTSTEKNVENGIATKKIYKQGKTHVYVAGQALGYWWRTTLQKNTWETSPLVRDNKAIFTAANPIVYADDDVFAYMKATKDFVHDDDGIVVMEKDKPKKEDVTVTRISPLKTSAIISAAAVSIAKNFSVMARQEGNPAPYTKEEYSAIMKCQFSLDLAAVGTFSNYNRAGYKNLSEKLKTEALEAGCKEIDDPFETDAKGNPRKLIRMPKDVRISRITDTLQALKILSGGAMQTNNMADVTPKFIILSTMVTGNHPFSHIVGQMSNVGDFENVAFLNFEALKEVLKDYNKYFRGTVFIGKRKGFWDEYESELKALEEPVAGVPTVKFGTIGETIDAYCKQVEEQLV